MNKHTKRKKGNDFEKELSSDIRAAGLDPKARRMVLSGGAFGLEGDIFTSLPIHFEAKRHETTKFKQWYAQAQSSASQTKIPVVVWKENDGIPFVFFEWQNFLALLLYAIKGGLTERLPFHK